jgi:hypothetical protein
VTRAAHDPDFPWLLGGFTLRAVAEEYSVARRPGTYVVTVPRTRSRPNMERCLELAEELPSRQGIRGEPKMEAYGGGERIRTSEPRGWIFTWEC